jgi:hypothetical protein
MNGPLFAVRFRPAARSLQASVKLDRLMPPYERRAEQAVSAPRGIGANASDRPRHRSPRLARPTPPLQRRALNDWGKNSNMAICARPHTGTCLSPYIAKRDPGKTGANSSSTVGGVLHFETCVSICNALTMSVAMLGPRQHDLWVRADDAHATGCSETNGKRHVRPRIIELQRGVIARWPRPRAHR